MAKDHGSSVKDDKQYEGLRKKGMSKSRAAAIANTPDASSKGGKKSGSGGGSSRSRKSSGGGSGGNRAQKQAPGARAGRPPRAELGSAGHAGALSDASARGCARAPVLGHQLEGRRVIPLGGMVECAPMEATTHHHHAMPTSGRALTGVALSATLHCLTGCAIGEVAGVAIGTALGWSDLATIALAIVLAFLFGYGLTSLPLLRAGFAVAAVVPIALASDTLSIAVMEIVDNGILLIIPGAMDAGLGDVLFWASLSVALVIAGLCALPVNRWLIARGKGHAVVHETGVHGGPSPRLIGAIAIVAAVFGTVVLIAEAFSG